MTLAKLAFLGTEALVVGAVSPRTLSSRYDRVHRNVYVPKGSDMTAAERAVAAWLWSGRHSTLAALSAAAIHGAKWIDPSQTAELYRRNGKPVEGILIHRDELSNHEVCRTAKCSRWRESPCQPPPGLLSTSGAAEDAGWRSSGWTR